MSFSQTLAASACREPDASGITVKEEILYTALQNSQAGGDKMKLPGQSAQQLDSQLQSPWADGIAKGGQLGVPNPHPMGRIWPRISVNSAQQENIKLP